MTLLKDLLHAIRTSGDKETWDLLNFIKAGARRDEIIQHMEDRGLVQTDQKENRAGRT